MYTLCSFSLPSVAYSSQLDEINNPIREQPLVDYRCRYIQAKAVK